jgi:hypothetical protein
MPTVKLVELPAFKLLDSDGLNWTAFRPGDPIAGKQILGAHLAHHGLDVEVVNLKRGTDEVEIGEVEWNDRMLRKLVVGKDWRSLVPEDADLWGVTVNYLQERPVARAVIRHLRSSGRPVVVGGSDAIGNPAPYLDAGASAVVTDKSGGANLDVVSHFLNSSPDGLSGCVLPDGSIFPNRRPRMSPEEWPLPSQDLVKATIGPDYWEAPIPDWMRPVGAVMLDIGCDRHCSFCQTPTYGLGYSWMSTERSLEWVAAQKEAGANSVIILSDQFLGRVLWEKYDGRGQIIEILNGIRSLDIPFLWGNGIELSKATKGRSLPTGSGEPDLELIEAVWGWDGRRGCGQTYIPAERPLSGTDSYAKLLPWQEHCVMLEAIVSAGVPDINYGVIVGLQDDSPAQMEALLNGVQSLRTRLKSINPALKFRVTPYAIRPLPGTEAAKALEASGMLRFEDPAIAGGFWTACADTKHMSYKEVSTWQTILMTDLSDKESDFQGITAIG